MRFAVDFIQLPSTLLIAAFTLAVSALPVDSVQLKVLTPDNFDTTVAEGVWFIEHFSPYCGHCRNFLPTWEKLVENVENQTDPGIHLAQINCAVDGDLCRQHGVDGYPQMNLYRNGKFVDTYREARAYDLLTAYLSSHAEPTAKPSPAPSPSATSVPLLQVNTSPEDRDIAKISTPAKDYNPSGSVLVLNDKTFRAAVAEGHIFVKFYAPWCGHCKKLAPIWKQLATQMQHKLTIAEVNCDEHNSLCRAEGVNGFPMLVYYGGNGGGKTEYTNGRKLDQLKAFAEKVSGPAVQEMKYEDLSARVEEYPVLYLLLHPSSSRRTVNEITIASQVLFGSPPVFTSDSKMLYDYFSVQPDSSVVLALKDHDPIPAAVYTFSPGEQNGSLVNWLLQNRFPASMEMDSDNFQDVMNAPHKPLVVVVATPKGQMKTVPSVVQRIAKQWRDTKRDQSVTFVWMDAEKWASWLKGMYGVKVDATPRIVVANHSRLVYYDQDQFGEPIQLTASSIFSAIGGAQSATIAYQHSENAVERMARYLNGKLTVVETYVTTHPWRTASFVLMGIVMLGLALRRLLSDSPDSRGREYGYASGMRKSDRLD